MQRAPRRGRRAGESAVVALAAAALLAACAGNARVTDEEPTPDSVAGTTAVAAAGPSTSVVPLPAEVPMYTVVQGDTIGKIAAKIGVDAQSIIDANGLANANKIQIGQKLRIPAGGKAADGSIVGIAPPTTVAAATATTKKP